MNKFKDYKLSEVGKWLGGGTPSKSNQLYWKNGSIPWVSPKDMKSLYIEKTQDYLTEKAIEESTAKIIPANSILIVTRSGILQHDVPIAVNKVPVAINQDLKAIIPNGKIKSDYLAHILRLEKNRILHECAKVGTTVESLGTNLLKGFRVEVPPPDIQEQILLIISRWDHKSTTLKNLIKAKKRYKKGLMQQLLSGKKRFPEFVKSKDKFETKFGNYPEDWRYHKIKTLAKQIRDRKEPKKDAYTVLSCTKYDGLVDSLEYFDRQVFSDDLSNYKVVEKGTFAYATNHIEEGSIGYNDWCENGLISPMYKVFKTDQEKVNDQYLYRVFKTEKYRHIFEINTNGTVNRRGSLNWKSFENIRVPLPPLEEQNKIADIMQRAEQEIALLEQELKAIKKQKKGLMQQLLTGKIRVNQGITKAESYG